MEELPPWLRDYMVGASQEVYQLRYFPETLVGRTFRDAAGFIFDSCHVVLLAVEARRGPGKNRMVVADLDQVRVKWASWAGQVHDADMGQKMHKPCQW